MVSLAEAAVHRQHSWQDHRDGGHHGQDQGKQEGHGHGIAPEQNHRQDYGYQHNGKNYEVIADFEYRALEMADGFCLLDQLGGFPKVALCTGCIYNGLASPLRMTDPEKTAWPICLFTGSDSPVRADWSTFICMETIFCRCGTIIYRCGVARRRAAVLTHS